MAFMYAYTCDACGAVADVPPNADHHMLATRRPGGWRQLDGRDFCTLPCLGRYANDPESVPRQQLAPSIFAEAGKRVAAELMHKKVLDLAGAPKTVRGTSNDLG